MVFRETNPIEILNGGDTLQMVQSDFAGKAITRWKLAKKYLSTLDVPVTREEQAIRDLVKHDVPILLKELLRLHPELKETPK
jgi:hypothetical protein